LVSLAVRPAGPDPVVVEPSTEARQMAEVRERLEARFPEVDPTVVEAAIRVSAAEITGPVRDFVPLLVERAARERLRRAVAGGTTDVGPDEDPGFADDPGRTLAASVARPVADVALGS